MYHFVYKTVNKVNGKYYYGVHSTERLDDGYLGSGLKLKAAIRKYGADNFERIIIALFDDRSEALIYERGIITEHDILSERCYNITEGGNAPPKQTGANIDKQRLVGEKRTEAQKAASAKHSVAMKNRKAPNATPITLFGVHFSSVTAALKYFDLSPSHYYAMVRNGLSFNTADELKQYTWELRNTRISNTKKSST